MNEIREKIRTFVENCLSEYPGEADWIKVEISARWGTVGVSLSQFGNPLYFSKEVKLAEIKERPDLKAIALEVYK